MNVLKFLAVTLLFFAVQASAQENKPFKAVDSLLEIRQPNAAQEKLWQLFDEAKTNDNQPVLVQFVDRIRHTLYATEKKERKEIFANLLNKSKKLPEPSQSILSLQLLQEVIYSQRFWFPNKSYEKDSLSFQKPMERFNYVLDGINELTQKLPALSAYKFYSFQKVIGNEKDSTEIFNSVADYLSYAMIDIYRSSLLEDEGTLKYTSATKKEWYSAPDQFNALQFTDSTLTERILFLFQSMEQRNKNSTSTQSIAFYQRLYFLSKKYNEPKLLKQGWENGFDFYKNDAARSKFLFELARLDYTKGKTYHYKNNPELEDMLKDVHTDLENELKQFPKNDFRAKLKGLIKIIEKQEVQLSTVNITSPKQAIPLKITHRNYTDYVLRVYKVKEYDPLKNTSLKRYLMDERLDLVQEQEVQLKNKKLYQTRATELLMDPIQNTGYYIIVGTPFTDSLSQFITSDSLWNATDIVSSTLDVSTFNVSVNNVDGQLTFLVVNQQTGEPVKGAEVNVYKSNYRRNSNYTLKRSGKTDKNGMYISSYTKNRDFYTISYKGAVLSGSQYTYRTISEKKQTYIEIVTDRAIYRPGQTVYFKCITFSGKENEFQVEPNTSINISVNNSSHQQIYTTELSTNEYGSIDGSFTLPKSGPLGDFLLYAEVNKMVGNSPRERYNFKVEEYKRPTFEVQLNQPKEEAKLNDSVAVTGKATAFAGYPITGAQVTYTVYRKWKRYWRSYFQSANSGGDLLVTDTVLTQDDGTFLIDFFAAVDENAPANAYYYYEIKAKVTDVSGETHEELLSLNLSKTGLSIQFNGTSTLKTHESEKAVVQVVNMAGEPQDGYDGTINVYRKIKQKHFKNRIWAIPETSQIDKKEMQKLFPYAQLDTAERASRKLIKTVSFSVGDTLSINDWIKNKQGDYVFELQTITSSNDTLTLTHNLEALDVTEKDLSSSQALWTYVSKNVAEVGESIDFQVGSSFDNARALVSKYRNEELISRKWVKVNHRFSECYTIQEEDRGSITYQVILFNNGEFYKNSKTITVPFSNKKLNIKAQSFRDLLHPGDKEQWSFTISDENNEMTTTELAATLYDASLDQFAKNSWYLWPYRAGYIYSNWDSNWNRNVNTARNFYTSYQEQELLNSNFFDYGYDGVVRRYYSVPLISKDGGASGSTISRKDIAQMPKRTPSRVASTVGGVNDENKTENSKPKPVDPRTNFNETAFFYPTIYSNDSNEYVLNFTLPESLTKWKLLMLGHTKEMQIGTFQKEVIAQKELMATANIPRFFRQDDKIDFAAKVVNLTDEDQKVEVLLKLKDPSKDKELDLNDGQSMQKTITIPANGTKEVTWNINIGNQEMIQYTLTAQNENFSDGEQNIIPVLSNRMLVTETDHVLLKKKGTYSHTFSSFANQQSSTLTNHSFVLEYTDNPAWDAIQALPYLSKRNNQSVTSLVNSYYANAIAKNIVEQNPEVKKIVNQWKNYSPDALLSELEKNEELKTILLEETPWVMEAKSETEQRRRIAQLFELNQLKNNQSNIIRKIKKEQNSDGGFGWFGGKRSNVYITQQIVTRIGQLKRLDIQIPQELKQILSKATPFLMDYHQEKYTDIDDKEEYQLSNLDIQWLYSTTFFTPAETSQYREIKTFYSNKLKKQWTERSLYVQALSGLYFIHNDMQKEADLVEASLLDRGINDDQIGMYWLENSGYYWYQNNIGTQAMIISFLHAKKTDQSVLDDARLWLIVNKESNAWKTGVTTADAIYALLESGRSYLVETKQPEITVGSTQLVFESSQNNDEIEVNWTPGLGEVKHQWNTEEIEPEYGEIKIEKKSESPSILNLYWQYTEQISKVSSSRNQSFMVKKTYQKMTAGAKEEVGVEDSVFHVGDRIQVVLTFRADRELEFVHLKDMRPAGFEPLQSTSGHNSSSGLWYYQSPKDASMNYFIEHLSKGTYQLTYSVYATHSGNFNSGVAEIQCLYAPEFAGNSASQGIRIEQQ